jgi:hypothetical protein
MGGEESMAGREDIHFERMRFWNNELSITGLVFFLKRMLSSCLRFIV